MRTYLISGPTGVIGKALVDRVVHTEPDAHFILLTRNKENTENSFKSLKNKEIIDWNDLTNYSFEPIDYVVHTAAPTASEYFVNKPVETIDSIVNCSKLLLTKAVGTNLKSFIFL